MAYSVHIKTYIYYLFYEQNFGPAFYVCFPVIVGARMGRIILFL